MRKDPILACLLNLLLVGTGHIYLGQTAKGLLILAFWIALALLTSGIAAIPLTVWAMYDAHRTAKRMNRSDRRTMTDSLE